jgi:hypothetical protein
MTEPDPKRASGAQPFAFTAQDALDFLQKMWNPLGVPLPGFSVPGSAQAPPGTTASSATPGTVGGVPFPNPATMFAALDPAEIERKIGELRVIENWLAMSLGMMQMSIKTLELQKASLEALRGGGSTAAASSPPAVPTRNPRNKKV